MHHRLSRTVWPQIAVAMAAVAGLALVSGIARASGDVTTPVPLAGRIVLDSYSSKAVRSRLHFSVYLPASYAAGTTRYPVVYFLHGLPGTPDDYKAIQPIARAIEQSGRQAIVVGVQGATAADSDPEWLDRGPGHNWETATAKELVSVVDARYRTIAARSGRLLVGISAGGYGATLIALHNPTTYAVVQSWSGYFHATTPDGTATLDLGSREANDRANAHVQIPVLRTLMAVKAPTATPSTFFGFYVGTDDAIFRAENVVFARELREDGISDVVFRVYPGGHNWSLWSAHAAKWLGDGLAFAAPPAL